MQRHIDVRRAQIQVLAGLGDRGSRLSPAAAETPARALSIGQRERSARSPCSRGCSTPPAAAPPAQRTPVRPTFERAPLGRSFQVNPVLQTPRTPRTKAATTLRSLSGACRRVCSRPRDQPLNSAITSMAGAAHWRPGLQSDSRPRPLPTAKPERARSIDRRGPRPCRRGRGSEPIVEKGLRGAGDFEPAVQDLGGALPARLGRSSATCAGVESESAAAGGFETYVGSQAEPGVFDRFRMRRGVDVSDEAARSRLLWQLPRSAAPGGFRRRVSIRQKTPSRARSSEFPRVAWTASDGRTEGVTG